MTQTETVWETAILMEYIKKRNLNLTQQFVDVGSGEGIHQSNSLTFISQGWKALLIDGLPENILKCKELYFYEQDKVKAICKLVSDEERPVCFSKDERHWALSTIREGEPNRITRKLSNILKAEGIGQIGILSLDIEGNEGGILKDLLENNIYPEIIIVEGNTFEAMQEHRDILAEHYTFAFGVFPNQVFKWKDL